MELNRTAKYAGMNATDVDLDKYMLGVVYQVNKDIQTGLLFVHLRNATNKAAYWAPVHPLIGANTYFQIASTLQPYFKAKVGPVALEGEFQYLWGEAERTNGTSKVKIENYALYLNALADLGMFYAGGTFAWFSGDKPGTNNKVEGGVLTGGIDWNPCLILWNYDKRYWAGALPGYNSTNATALMANVWFGQLKAGVRPIPALDIMASISYAETDKKPTGFVEKDYGWELDVTATYAITNNLSYMLGVGYLWTGDYYKGISSANKLNDDYLVVNKLTLTF